MRIFAALSVIIMYALFLAGCTGTDKPPVVQYVAAPLERPVLLKPHLPPLNLTAANVMPRVLTPETVQEMLAAGEEFVFVAVSFNEWEQLSLKEAALLRHIADLNAVIAAYRRYYERAEAQFDTADGFTDCIGDPLADCIPDDLNPAWEGAR